MNEGRKKILYVLESLNISGGVIIILQHANRLKRRGFDVRVLLLDEKNDSSWFPGNEVKIYKFSEKEELLKMEIDIAVATHFHTVKFVWSLPANRKIYFVQSDERRFGMEDPEAFMECEETYRSSFEFMTEAIWIQRWLKEEFGHDAYYVPNGLDEKTMHEVEPLLPKSEKTRILLEGSIDVPFKGMMDSYDAIKDLDCELWIVSNHGKPKEDWKYDKFFEKVPFDKMKEIYSSCDIFLKMSRVEGFFGPPMEAMACGCAVVVGKVTGYDEYIKNEHNALVVDQRDIEGAKKAVQKLINDTDLRNRLIENGHKTAQQWNWDRSIDLLEKVIKKEPVEIFYTESFPERYDYNLGVKNALLDTIDKVGKERDLHQAKAGQLELEIDFMKGSVFWKMRGMYLKAKKKLSNPFRKMFKYLNKTTYLVQSLFLTISNEGFGKAFLRLYNFARYGKGVLNYDEEILSKEKYIPLKEVLNKFKEK